MKNRIFLLVVLGAMGLLWLSSRKAEREDVAEKVVPLETAEPARVKAGKLTQPSSPKSLQPTPSTVNSEPIVLAYPKDLEVTEPKFARFNDWATRYLNSAPENKAELEEEGIRLAEQRREEMKDLIQADPERALELAFPRVQRRVLPVEVQAVLEEPISARGDFQVLAALPRDGEAVQAVTRKAIIEGRNYKAFVYGRMEGAPTLTGAFLNGVAVYEYVALNETPARLLGSDEVAERLAARSADPVCSISGEVTTIRDEEVMVEAAGEIFELCGVGHVGEFNNQLRAAAGENSNFMVDGEGYFKPMSTYTEGIKKLVVIRVDFSDDAGEPFSFSSGTNMISELNKFYQAMSYGRAGFALNGAGSLVTTTLRMPRTATWYGTNDASRLRSDARAAARTAGINLDSFNFDIVCFSSVPGYSWGGLGYVGAPGAWMQGGASVGIAAHELGHNYGLNHANFWDTAGQSIIGSGTSVEYGDKFDTMGSANAGAKHFNARYKNYLNWLRSTEVQTASTSGQYRLFPMDDPLVTNGIRGLRIVKNSSTNYWLEFRNKYPSNRWLPMGVGVRWAGNDGRSSMLLDLTPGSANTKDDSPLLLGRTFSDRVSNIHITPVRKGGTTAVPYIDVVVNRGAFAGNIPPQIELLADSTNAAPGALVHLNAATADANGDTLAYFWDFGDGNFGENEPALSHSWSSTGEYVVQCTVSDMKGGIAVASLIVRVGSPVTFSISGRVTDGLNPLAGVKVAATSTKFAHTDSNGRYYITGLSSGSYTMKASMEGMVFSRLGFSNPILLGPSRNSIDFVGVTSTAESTTTLVAAGSVWKYKDDGSNQGTAWRGTGFNDQLWSAGPSPLGYGDDGERTVLRYGTSSANKHVTTYFRHKFEVEDRSSILGLTLRLRRDDGGVVYLNNREVFRSNMPGGTIGYTTLASSSVGGADETTFFETELDPAWLINGANVLAVEIHQRTRDSTDIAMDLELVAVTTEAFATPTLAWEPGSSGLSLSWPESPGTWGLYSSTEIGPTAQWEKVTTAQSSVNGVWNINVPMTNTGTFYKLVREN